MALPEPLGASVEGTARYQARFPAADPGHFRLHQGLRLSSIGLGTYLGEPDAETTARYVAAVIRAVQIGCNVIDTAINYRFQESERDIGTALADMFRSGRARRDEVVVCTKGGYLSFDRSLPSNSRRWVTDTFITPGLIDWSDIVSSNVMHPRYIRHELERSLENLGISCIDVYYLHNPESQLEAIDRREFARRMHACFEELERCVADGRIASYGTATWNGYRVAPEEPGYLSLYELVEIARSIAGDAHHFHAIQLPMNLAMTEALTIRNQHGSDSRADPASRRWLTILEAAEEMGITVFASASLLQSKLVRLPGQIREQIPIPTTDAQRALQFVRSAPGITTALVGMKEIAHVEENLALGTMPPISRETFEHWIGNTNGQST